MKKYKIYTDAIAAVNDGTPMPKRLGACAEFSIKWHASDAWRGYYDATAEKTSGWIKIDSDWLTGDYPDAGDHASSNVEAKFDALAESLEAEGYEMVVICMPTSNVFSTAYDIFKRPRMID